MQHELPSCGTSDTRTSGPRGGRTHILEFIFLQNIANEVLLQRALQRPEVAMLTDEALCQGYIGLV